MGFIYVSFFWFYYSVSALYYNHIHLFIHAYFNQGAFSIDFEWSHASELPSLSEAPRWVVLLLLWVPATLPHHLLCSF